MTDYTHLESVANANANGLHFSNDQGFGHNLSNANSMELFVQQQINQQQLLSPTIHQRHDSLFQCSPSSTPRASISQQQAEGQPCALAPMTPHTRNGYPLRPVSMSRSESQYSSTSSGHYQRYGSQHRAARGSFGNASPPIAPNMSPSTSQYSVASTVRQSAPQTACTQPHRDTVNFFPPRPLGLPPTSTPPNHPSDQTTRYSAVPMFEFDVNEIMGGTLAGEEDGSKIHGQMPTSSGNIIFLAPFSPDFRPQLGSVGLPTPRESSILASSYSEIENVAASQMPLVSSNHDALPPSQQLVRRRRRSSLSPDGASDPVIGQVTRLGKFRCLDSGCDDLTFGRQADFKRHYENVHAPRKIEYFCPEEGCSRSRNPANGKSKGRSFNSRKDKMEEHVRTVHQKECKKRKQVQEVQEEDEGDSLDERIRAKRPRIKRRWS
ncbi:Nn.00g110950.m01.CDS01 [Neocucurbitaria sp. VM-36]